MIGQPPRSKGKGFDQHELEVWFDQIYRNQTTSTSAPAESGSGSAWAASARTAAAQATEAAREARTLLTTLQNLVIGSTTSKRYLRWMQL